MVGAAQGLVTVHDECLQMLRGVRLGRANHPYQVQTFHCLSNTAEARSWEVCASTPASRPTPSTSSSAH
jgi:hypothetical protein